MKHCQGIGISDCRCPSTISLNLQVSCGNKPFRYLRTRASGAKWQVFGNSCVILRVLGGALFEMGHNLGFEASSTGPVDDKVSGSGRQAGRSDTLQAVAPTCVRRWPRFAMDVPLQLQVSTQGPTRLLTCPGHGTDISYGGLAVTTDIDLPVGTQIGVEFTPPGTEHRLVFRGVIRNRDGNCYGVQFIVENDEDYRNAAELQAALAAMNARPI